MASLVLSDSSQLTSDSQHLCVYSSPTASLVLSDSSQLTSDSQHLCVYSSPMASLVLTDSSQLTSDSQHLAVSCQSAPKKSWGYLYIPLLRECSGSQVLVNKSFGKSSAVVTRRVATDHGLINNASNYWVSQLVEHLFPWFEAMFDQLSCRSPPVGAVLYPIYDRRGSN
uniref:Uncharacterized protein n=1 Tax=Timema poppense TaxID=170557 RepID=A0A7R9HES2_TIMPO|nr:unnamed protein product [Timema poppensis]